MSLCKSAREKGNGNAESRSYNFIIQAVNHVSFWATCKLETKVCKSN